jgi:hypothetical protein
MQLQKKINDLPTGTGVQVTGRFVRQNNVRLVDQGACNGYALLLSSGELTGLVMHPICKPHLRECRFRAGQPGLP